MADLFKNFSISAVAVAPSPATTGTTVTVTTGQGSRFPTPPFNVVVHPSGSTPDPTNAEVARCTNVAGDVLTLTRAQEGSSARSIVVGDTIGAYITAKALTERVTPRPARFLISNRALDNPDYLVDPSTGAATRTSDGASLGTGADKAWQAALDGCGTYQNRTGLIQWADGDYHLKGPLRMDSKVRMSGAGTEETRLIVDSDFSVGTLTGFLDATNGVPRAGVITPDWQSANAYTGGRWEIDRLAILMNAYTSLDLCGINYTTDAQPSSVFAHSGSVDPGHRIDQVLIDRSPTHGIAFVVGGYSGGARESRLTNIECRKSGNRTTAATVTTKALTTNVATITTSAAHNFVVGGWVTVALSPSDAVFDGLQQITAVTSTTFSFAKTNANVASTGAGGTATSGYGWDFWLDASDLYVHTCTGNGARSGGFAVRGGNHRYTNSKAYFSGNVTPNTLQVPGFDIGSQRCVMIGCEAQDNGGEGFLIRAAGAFVDCCMGDSNGAYVVGASRSVQQSSNFAVTANSCHIGGISLFRTGGNGDPGFPIFFVAGRSFISGDLNISRASGTFTTSPTATTPNNALTSSTFTMTGSAT